MTSQDIPAILRKLAAHLDPHAPDRKPRRGGRLVSPYMCDFAIDEDELHEDLIKVREWIDEQIPHPAGVTILQLANRLASASEALGQAAAKREWKQSS